MVLNEISISFETGQCIGILGANGCGKTTLLSILAGDKKADAGSFLFCGIDFLKDAKKRREMIGYVPQGIPLIEELTAYDNLRLWYGKKELQKELQDGVLKMLGIDAFLKTSVMKMSGGMKKRVSIGCAMANHPKILLLDEPSAALDLVCKEAIYQYLKAYKKNGGTIFLITHDREELSLCDVCYILKDGTAREYHFDKDMHTLVQQL